MRKTFIGIIALMFASCKKQNSSINYGYNSYYHIENGDTISWIHVPNSFTPNGDGINDVFIPKHGGASANGYTLHIYDVTSTTIFVNTDINNNWDGTHGGSKSPNGWYTFNLKTMDSTGYNYNISNDVYLVR